MDLSPLSLSIHFLTMKSISCGFLSVILSSVCCFHNNLFAIVLAFRHSTIKAPFRRILLEDVRRRDASTSLQSTANQVLILDHLNINHEKGRHDLLKAFYFDFLQCAIDPRKEENLKVGKKTLWANIGTFQFHLPEGNPAAQVFQGIVTLAYPSIKDVLDHYERNLQLQTILGNSKFSIMVMDDELHVTDPWGTQFRLIQDSSNYYADTRGCQPGEKSKGIAMTDLTIFLSDNVSNFAGIARFYERILGAPCLDWNESLCVVSVGPKQTLSFRRHAKAESSIHHEELVQTEEGGSVTMVRMYPCMFPTCEKPISVLR